MCCLYWFFPLIYTQFFFATIHKQHSISVIYELLSFLQLWTIILWDSELRHMVYWEGEDPVFLHFLEETYGKVREMWYLSRIPGTSWMTGGFSSYTLLGKSEWNANFLHMNLFSCLRIGVWLLHNPVQRKHLCSIEEIYLVTTTCSELF